MSGAAAAISAAAVTALAIPGAVTSQAPVPSTGLAALEPRFLSIMTSAGVPEAKMEELGTKGYKTVGLYGNVAATREKMEGFLKAVLNVDPAADAQDYLLLAQLLTAWDGCRARVEVETRHNAERAVNQLSPQLSSTDYELAVQAFERMQGYEPGKYPRHWIPSQPFWERLVGQAESSYDIMALTRVTSRGQEDTNQSEFGGVDLGTGLFKIKKPEFAVAYPTCPESLRNRLKALAVNWMMVQARFPSNPKLATATLELFNRYVEYLIGPHVWGMVSMGLDGRPVSSPCIEHVLGYDQALRKYAADAMNAGWDVKTAFEKALADHDTRQLFFTSPVAIDAGSGRCTSITAPGLQERFPSLPIPPNGGGCRAVRKGASPRSQTPHFRPTPQPRQSLRTSGGRSRRRS